MEKKQKLPDSQCVVIIHSNEQDAESVKRNLKKFLGLNPCSLKGGYLDLNRNKAKMSQLCTVGRFLLQKETVQLLFINKGGQAKKKKFVSVQWLYYKYI